MNMNLKALLLALSLLSLIVLPTLPANAGITVPNPHTYTYLTTAGPESTDPAWAYDAASAEVIINVYQCLIDFNFVYYDQYVEEIADWWPGKGENPGNMMTPLPPDPWQFDNAVPFDPHMPVGTVWGRKCIEWTLMDWVDNGDEILGYCDYVYMGWVYDPLWPVPAEATEILEFHVDNVIVLCDTYYQLILQPTFLDSTWKFHIRNGMKWQDPAYGTVNPFDVEVTLERGMVMDHRGGPQWMFFEPLTPSYGTRDGTWNWPGYTDYDPTKPDDTARLARWIDDAIESDLEMVWFNLDQPYIPFQQILCQSWGSVMSHKWLYDIGAWDLGWHCPCHTMDGYMSWGVYNNPVEPGPVGSNAMGSGPYYVDYIDVTSGYFRLRKFDNYYFGWDREHCDTIVHEVDLNWATRKARFLSSDPAVQADEVTVLRGDVNDPELLAAIDACDVRYLPHLATLQADAIFWCYDFRSDSPYMHHFGDGVSTAEAIACTILLSDEHMRYALNYCKNVTEFIEDYYLGEAVPLHNPIKYGIAYANATKHSTMYYPLDIEKATYHFMMAWGGTDYEGDGVCDVPGYIWRKGFHITMVPFPDVDPRTEICYEIEYVVENLIPWEIPSECIDVEVFPLDWREGIIALHDGLLGAFVCGWQADFPHPHDWVFPFMHTYGTFSYFQNINYGHQDLMLHNITPLDLANPVCSEWYLEPSCPEYHLGGWTDNGNGVLDYCDYVDLAVLCDGVPLDYYEYHVESIEWDAVEGYYRMHVRREIAMNWHPKGNYGQAGLPYFNYNGYLVTEIDNDYVDNLVSTGIRTVDIAVAERLYTELMDIYFAEDASRMTFQPEGRRYERTWCHGWFYNCIYAACCAYDCMPGLMFYGPPGTMNLWKQDPQTYTRDLKVTAAIPWSSKDRFIFSWDIHNLGDGPENYKVTVRWWSNGWHTLTEEGWVMKGDTVKGELDPGPGVLSIWGAAMVVKVQLSPWVGHYVNDQNPANNGKYTVALDPIGDMGGPINYVPTYFAFDGKVDAYDLALWINAQKYYKGPPYPPSPPIIYDPWTGLPVN